MLIITKIMFYLLQNHLLLQKNKLVVGTTKVKGMDLEALHDAVQRYLSGWHARQHLESM